MELGTKVNGRITKPVEKGNFGMLMVIFSRENGKMTKQMDTECISM